MSKGLDMRSFFRRVLDRKKHHENEPEQALVPRNALSSRSLDPAMSPTLSESTASEPYVLFELVVPNKAEVDVVFIRTYGPC